MKRFYLLIFCTLVALSSWAQEGLAIKEIFDGKMIRKEQIQETYIKGELLKEYKLNTLRTIKFTASETEREKAEAIFMKDLENNRLTESESCKLEVRNNHLYYAIVQLSDTGKQHRYICFQGKKTGQDYAITLVYIEGMATLTELEHTLKRK